MLWRTFCCSLTAVVGGQWWSGWATQASPSVLSSGSHPDGARLAHADTWRPCLFTFSEKIHRSLSVLIYFLPMNLSMNPFVLVLFTSMALFYFHQITASCQERLSCSYLKIHLQPFLVAFPDMNMYNIHLYPCSFSCFNDLMCLGCTAFSCQSLKYKPLLLTQKKKLVGILIAKAALLHL